MQANNESEKGKTCKERGGRSLLETGKLTIFLEVHQTLDNVGVQLGVLVFPLSAGPFSQPSRLLYLSGCWTAVGISYEKHANEVSCLLTNILPDILWFELKFTTENVLTDLHKGFRTTTAAKWRIARQKKKGDDTNGPYVASFIITTSDDLRSNSIRRTDRLVLDLAELEMLGQTKINHLELRIGRGVAEQEIFQLQVTMDDALGVDISDGTQHLLHQASALRLCVVIVGLLIESIKQLTAQTQFLDKVDLRMRLVHLL